MASSRHRSRSDSRLSFCNLLNRVRPELTEKSSSNKHALCSFATVGRINAMDKIAVLGVIQVTCHVDQIRASLDKTGYITSTTPPNYTSTSRSLKGRVIDARRVDFALVRSWLHRCQSEHGSRCQREAQRQPHTIHLIDCRSRRVEQASPSTPYCALSYVWGRNSQNESTLQPCSNALPSRLPQTIEDAILVTLSMGYNFLWIDKFCISQDNPIQKRTRSDRCTLSIKTPS